VGIAFGLGAALSWGFADYFAALASRRMGALRVVLWFHLVATGLLAALVVATDALSGVTWSDVTPFVLVGALGWLSYLAFYAALAIGPISVVSPIVSGYAAVTVVLAVVIIGERLGALPTIAVVLTIVGVMATSANVRDVMSSSIDRRAMLGLVLAVLAMVLLGGFVFAVAYRQQDLGWLAPIFLARAFSTLFLLGHATVTRELGSPDWSRGLLLTVVGLAIVDTSGYALFNIGVGVADTSVVATASAPYAVVPIVMGVVLLSERPARTQWLGIALVLAGIVLLGLTS
jgi:drug/metabolite transporter (DMT)-like permease